MEDHFGIDDDTFERMFEQGALDAGLFNHEAHLRLAWIHVSRYGEEQALDNINRQLLNFVKGLGAGDKYNKTLTCAAIKAVNHFINKSSATNFKDFIEEFPRLKFKFKELMGCHYSMDIFNDELAKKEYLEPDVLPFD